MTELADRLARLERWRAQEAAQRRIALQAEIAALDEAIAELRAREEQLLQSAKQPGLRSAAWHATVAEERALLQRKIKALTEELERRLARQEALQEEALAAQARAQALRQRAEQKRKRQEQNEARQQERESEDRWLSRRF